MNLIYCLLLLVLAAAVERAPIKISSCSDVSRYSKVTVVAAHPDDIETIAGGTIALFTNCGIKTSYIITTNGDKGWGKGYNMTSPVLAGIREIEQIQAGAVLGVTNITFLHQGDGRLEGSDPIALKKNLTKWLRVYQPDLLLTFSPEIDYPSYKFGVMHTDHQVTGRVALSTVWPAVRDYLSFVDLFDEGYMPWIVPEVWLFVFSAVAPVGTPDIVTVNICGQLFDQKYSALLEHKSQYENPLEVKESLTELGAYVYHSFYSSEQTKSKSSCELSEAFQQIHIL